MDEAARRVYFGMRLNAAVYGERCWGWKRHLTGELTQQQQQGRA